MFTVMFDIKLGFGDGFTDQCDVSYRAHRIFDSLDDAVAFKDAMGRGRSGTMMECHAIFGHFPIWCRIVDRPDCQDKDGWYTAGLEDAREKKGRQ